MTTFMRRLCAAVLIATLTSSLCACEEDDGRDPSVNVTGSWRLNFDTGLAVSMVFEQDSDGHVQGVGQDQNGTPWSFSGVVDDDRMSGTSIPDISIEATVSEPTMTGTWKQNDVAGTFAGVRH